MKTMTAFWRYDWTLNWPRHIALVAVAVVLPWIMEGSNAATSAGLLWAPYLGVVSGTLMIVALPLLFLGNLTEVGRAASPQEFRHFVHTLPVDRGEWAMAKLASAFVAVGLVPLVLLTAMVYAAKLVFGTPFGLKPGFFEFSCILLVGTVWTMFWAAVLPHRWVTLGIPVFILGEGLARGMASFEGVAAGFARTLLVRSVDMGLQALLAVLLAAVFVLYHQRRSRGWALAAAFLVLVGVDGLRAVVGWLISAY